MSHYREIPNPYAAPDHATNLIPDGAEGTSPAHTPEARLPGVPPESIALVPLPIATVAGSQYIGPAWQRLFALTRAHQIELNGHADYLSPTVAEFRGNAMKPRNQEFPVFQFAIAMKPEPEAEPVPFDALSPTHVVGTASAILPQLENTHTATIDIFVEPAHRRRGIGTAALRELRAFAREHERTQLETWPTTLANDDGARVAPRIGVGALPAENPTVHFLHAQGFGLEMVEKVSELNLETLKGRLVSGAIIQPELDPALEVDTYGSEIVENITPEFVEAINAFNADHPQSDSAAPYTTTVEQFTRDMQASIDRGYTHRGVIIREREAGRIVATTETYFRSSSSVAAQADTWVHADYRGRGLATLAKIELYLSLLLKHPRITRVATENAESNVGMWTVNERLGFEVIAANSHWVSVFNGDVWAPFTDTSK